MISPPTALHLIKELKPGTIPFDIFDRKGVLMFSKGMLIEEDKVTKLMDIGVFRASVAQHDHIRLPLGEDEGAKDAGSGVTRPKGELITEFPDTCVNTGEFLILSSSTAIGGRVKIYGKVGKDALLVAIPVSEGKYVAVKETTVFEAKYFNGEDIYNFNAEIIDVVWSPIALMVIKYPKHITKLKVRGSKRADVSIIGTIKLKSNTTSKACRIVNLSEGGAQIESKAFTCEPSAMTELSFSMEFDGEKQVVSLTAECMRCDESGTEGIKSIGLKFKDNTLVDRLFLASYMSSMAYPK